MPHVMTRVQSPTSPTGQTGQIRPTPPAPGDIIHYRLTSMAVGDPERVQTVDRILDNGTLVLADGEYLRRQDLASLRVAAPEFVSDHATDDPPDPVHAPAAGPGTAERPLGTRADPTVGAPSAPGTPAAPAVAGLGVPPLGGPQSPAAPAFPMTTLSDRLMAMVERIADSEALLARAERALEILETAP